VVIAATAFLQQLLLLGRRIRSPFKPGRTLPTGTDRNRADADAWLDYFFFSLIFDS
jgi:hypothetical protein